MAIMAVMALVSSHARVPFSADVVAELSVSGFYSIGFLFDEWKCHFFDQSRRVLTYRNPIDAPVSLQFGLLHGQQFPVRLR